MAFDGRVFRILIASPSDVEEERETAVRVIQEWNDLYSYTRQVVLLPLRWETHSAPEYGVRPQEVINRVIVDECDLLIGVFWTRIGTPTGEADSGTLEEIERVAKAGKPVMLYFSKVGIDPDQLDLAQVAKLKKFKSKTYSNALVENYKSIIEYRDKLARQLELKVRELQKADNVGGPSVSLEYINDEGESLGSLLSLKVPKVTGIEELVVDLTSKERDRFRNILDTQLARSSSYPIRLAISNSGTSGVRNLYAEISAETISGHVVVHNSGFAKYVDSTAFIKPIWRKSVHVVPEMTNVGSAELPVYIDNQLAADDDGNVSVEWAALQPRRSKYLGKPLYVIATEAAELEVKAKVFADSFPQPLELKAIVKFEVNDERIPIEVLVPNVKKLREKVREKVREETADD